MKTNIRVTLATTFLPSMDRFRLARTRLKELKDYAWDLRDLGTDLVEGDAQTMKFLLWNGLRIRYVYRPATDEVVLLQIEKDVPPPPPPPPAAARNRPQHKLPRSRRWKNLADVLVRLLSRWLGQFNDLATPRAAFQPLSPAVPLTSLSKVTDTARSKTRVLGRAWSEVLRISHGDGRPVLNSGRYLPKLSWALKIGSNSPEIYELIDWSKVPNRREHKFAWLQFIGYSEDNVASFLSLVARAIQTKCKGLTLRAGEERESAICKLEYIRRTGSVLGIGRSSEESTFRESTRWLQECGLHLRSSAVRIVRKTQSEFCLSGIRRNLERNFMNTFALRWIEGQCVVHLPLR